MAFRETSLRWLREVRSDSRDLLNILGGYAYSIAAPPRFDDSVAAFLLDRRLRKSPAFLEETAERMNAIMGVACADLDLSYEAERYHRLKYRAAIVRARSGRRKGWEPTFESEGWEIFESALEAGKGVILWRIASADNHVVNRAFWQLGHPVAHLSHERHLVRRDSWLHWRVLGPVLRRPENRYLRERFVIRGSGSLDYMRALLTALGNNAAVSINGETFFGRRFVEVPFFEGTRAFPTGAPSIAHKTEAALLPIRVRWLNADRYVVIVEEPIRPSASSKTEFVQEAICEYAMRIQNAIMESPADWLGWWAASYPG